VHRVWILNVCGRLPHSRTSRLPALGIARRDQRRGESCLPLPEPPPRVRRRAAETGRHRVVWSSVRDLNSRSPHPKCGGHSQTAPTPDVATWPPTPSPGVRTTSRRGRRESNSRRRGPPLLLSRQPPYRSATAPIMTLVCGCQRTPRSVTALEQPSIEAGGGGEGRTLTGLITPDRFRDGARHQSDGASVTDRNTTAWPVQYRRCHYSTRRYGSAAPGRTSFQARSSYGFSSYILNRIAG
jgi:hypothetical protein